MESGIKRGLLSPSYMREAWRAEMRMLAAEKLSHAEMLVRSSPGYARLHFDTCIALSRCRLCMTQTRL